MTEVLDVSRDDDTGEITQFLILGNDGQPDTKIASPENLLLYDPEDELPFDGGMDSFLSGGSALRISTEPEVLVSRAGDEYSYVLSVGGNTVETTPKQADELLQGVYDTIAEDDTRPIEKLYDRIIKNQVRRHIVNTLAQTFEESHRLSITREGWLVDEFYLVDWNAKMYTANDSLDEGDFIVRSGSAVKKDKSYEFVKLNHSVNSGDGDDVVIDGDEYTLSQREMLFLAKIKWLLHRRHYHPDTPFWEFCDRWTDVEEEEPDIGVFDI